MKKILTFIKNLKFIFYPHYWMMNYPFNQEIDDELNYLMDNFEPVLGFKNELTFEYYDVTFGNKKVWIQNYPYAYGKIYLDEYQIIRLRPSRLTIERLAKLLSKKLNLKYDGTKR